MSKGILVHVSDNPCSPGGIVGRYAEEHGMEYIFRKKTDSMFRTANVLKNASFAVIWNGRQRSDFHAGELCRRRNIPHCFIEQGMLPQKETFFVDPKGFVGDSTLAGELSWVTNEDMVRLQRERRRLQQLYPLSDEGYVLVPLQVCNDSQMLYYSHYKSMGELVAHVEEMYPGMRIVARPHPKGKKRRKFARAENKREGSFFEQASRASVIVSATSTCLYEAAILGKPVVALGDHPLRIHSHEDRDRVLAGALAMTVRRNGNLGDVLDRFGVRPIGSTKMPVKVEPIPPSCGHEIWRKPD